MASLQRAGAMIPLAFHGGTALRFLYSLPRYSEDLGFALERPGPGYDFRAYLRAVRSDLEREGYAVDVTVSDQKTVHSAFVRFIGLVYELRLSLHRDEVLRVKIEVDTNPPAGAILATSVVRRHVTLQLQHHDPASLLAGKLHAVLHRPYPKGRDIYDLLWYLSDRQWPAPNLAMLGNALQQTGWHGVQPTKDSWRHIVRQRIETVDWQRLVADVGPFLEDGLELAVFTRENLLQVLERE
ncbi:MAG: nucleotidyl transferase AbiEii/AbiGii toxin family protein [Chloroflexi bacterium]|nr:nucleotidyl transferase AbiEii/AbiGii toxin family protein [Chloroflexota bacterium]